MDRPSFGGSFQLSFNLCDMPSRGYRGNYSIVENVLVDGITFGD